MITKAFTDSQETKESYSKLFKTASDVLTRIKNAENIVPIQDNDQVFYTFDAELQNKIKAINDSDILINTDIDVDSLGEYFSMLEYLKEIHPRFLRLPIDEDLFKIDANTRIIELPKNNYVYAVLGDKNAETVYFSIDRYYDIFDLGSEDIQIVIQAEKNIKGELKSFLFSATDKDVDSEPGTVIFGWILPEEITSSSGQVRFSVRFYHIDENNKIAFSLGTLPTTLTVENSILNEVDLSVSANITTTDTFIKNYARSGTEPIAKPTIDTLAGENVDIVLPEDDYAILTCVASTIQASQIDYKWYIKKANGEFGPATSVIAGNCIEEDNYASLGQLTQSNFNAKITASLDPNSEDTYYIFDTTPSLQMYRLVTASDKLIIDDGEEDDIVTDYTLYEQIPGKILKTKQGGIYLCRVKVTASRYSKTVDTDEINVLSACPVNFKNSLASGYFTTGTITTGDDSSSVVYSLSSDDFAINETNIKWSITKDSEEHDLTYGDNETTKMTFKDDDETDINLANIRFNDNTQVLDITASLTNTVNFTTKSTTTPTSKRTTKFYKPLCPFTVGLDEDNRTFKITYNTPEADFGYITYDDAIKENGLDPEASRNITFYYIQGFNDSYVKWTGNTLDDAKAKIADLGYTGYPLSQFITGVEIKDTILGKTETGTYGTIPSSS